MSFPVTAQMRINRSASIIEQVRMTSLDEFLTTLNGTEENEDMLL
jgi:hypothetical protein